MCFQLRCQESEQILFLYGVWKNGHDVQNLLRRHKKRVELVSEYAGNRVRNGTFIDLAQLHLPEPVITIDDATGEPSHEHLFDEIGITGRIIGEMLQNRKRWKGFTEKIPEVDEDFGVGKSAQPDGFREWMTRNGLKQLEAVIIPVQGPSNGEENKQFLFQ